MFYIFLTALIVLWRLQDTSKVYFYICAIYEKLAPTLVFPNIPYCKILNENAWKT